MPTVLSIDLQYDFLALGVQNQKRISKAICLPTVVDLLQHARQAGWTVIHVFTEHDGKHTLPRRLQQRGETPYCVAGTPGVSVIEETREHGERCIAKQSFSAFVRTGIERIIPQDVPLVLCGVATDCCVMQTCFDASERHGFDVFIPYDATSASSKRAHIFGLESMAKSAGRVLAAEDLMHHDPHLWGNQELRAGNSLRTSVEAWHDERVNRLKSLIAELGRKPEPCDMVSAALRSGTAKAMP